jgi:hypothetical protein
MKNVRILSLVVCGSLLLNSTGANGLSALLSAAEKIGAAIPTIMKVVGAVAAVGQMATGIAIMTGGQNIDQSAAAMAAGIFGGIGGIAGSFNAAGDVFVTTDQEMATLEANKQNLTHVIPAEAPTNPEGKNWAKIMLPAVDGRTMIQLPKITSGSRAGQDNKIVVQLTKVSRTEKDKLKNFKPVIEGQDGNVATTVVPAAKLVYKVTFYGIMKTDNGSGIELGSIMLPTNPGSLLAYVKPNGELNLLGTAQGNTVFTEMPAQFTAQEWQKFQANRMAAQQATTAQ